MTQFERRNEIWQEIERLQAEIDACPHGSSEHIALLRKLTAALQAYHDVPSDEARRAEINARLDQLQAVIPPTDESLEEFFALCRELQTLPPCTPRKSFQEGCWQMRGFIWFLAILFFLTSLFFAPPLADLYTWVPAFCILGSVACFVFAFWASTYRP